ncbi:MAG: biotin/lipoyl-binding carrier protein [Pseudomonadota bacterium]
MGKRVEVMSEVTGNVWKVLAVDGQRVAEGDALVIVESMKMEIPVEAPCAGTVRQLSCAEGQPVAEGEVVAVIEAD